MQRQILCPACGSQTHGLYAEDKAAGFVNRTVRVVSKRPEGHGYSLSDETGKTKQNETPLMCDLCSAALPDGEIVYARTTWNTKREGTPGNWEKDFGTVIPDDAANVAETLSKPSE